MKKNNNGINQFTPEQEEIRMRVVDAELKARYWKAQYEVKMYTIQADKMDQEYQDIVERQRKADLELREMWKKQMEENLKQGITMEQAPDSPEITIEENETQSQDSTDISG
jgi:hypothetical protein